MAASSNGTYCLVISTKKDLKKTIGALGEISFKPGLYIYIGSALKNMDKRISRHFGGKKKIFWHIDRLTTDRRFSMEGVFVIKKPQKLECKKAEKMAGIFSMVAGFGSSDCRCRSHLFFTGKNKGLSDIEDIITGEMGFKRIT